MIFSVTDIIQVDAFISFEQDWTTRIEALEKQYPEEAKEIQSKKAQCLRLFKLLKDSVSLSSSSTLNAKHKMIISSLNAKIPSASVSNATEFRLFIQMTHESLLKIMVNRMPSDIIRQIIIRKDLVIPFNSSAAQ